MTTTTAAREAIYLKFITDFGTAQPTVVITADNEGYEPVTGTDFVRLSVRHQTAAQESLGDVGGRKFTRGGLIQIQVFTSQNAGQRASDSLVDSVISVLEGTRLLDNDVRIQAAIVREIGPMDGFNMVVVEFPFEYTQRR